ncbi:MAG TPA: FHA domain-containing protein [Gemmatirosa sp.]|nr:FHA domain-containing protein [Gemmatirosa sp.]
MPDGRLIALIVLVVGLVAVGGYFWWDHIKHGRAEARGARRPVERLPLFGTDQLVPRGMETTEDGAGTGAPRRTPPKVKAMQGPGFPIAAASTTQPIAAPVRPGAPPASPFAPPMGQHPVSAPALAATDTHRAVSVPTAQTASSRAPMPLNGPLNGPVNGPVNGPRDGRLNGPLEAAPNGARHARHDGPLHEGETLRFAIPDEGTLQFLPGRLEVVAGPDAGREIRFIRPPGPEQPVITFGRSEGPAYAHVQLLARTVSRRHAQMTLVDEHWTLQNLSSTNPVTLNGRPLAPDEVAPLLVDGDRIEMGEVVFQFHGR